MSTKTSVYAVQLDQVSKVYGSGKAAVRALDDVSTGIDWGTFTAIMGPSGSGKSTFLHCAAGLDRPTSGRVWLGDTELSKLKEDELTAIRRERIGFVFQAYNLLGSLTVEQNITLPRKLANRPVDPGLVRDVVKAVELDGLLNRRPSQLSGGQQQRVTIARALITKPDAVFADEPTGALDSRISKQVLGLLRQVVDSMGQSVVMVTHDPVAASYADSVMFLADGRFADELRKPSPAQIAERMTHLGEW
jgi:putative ABC transport system ATP-binding protein